MVALTARMQHERNYNDEQLQRLTGMRRLNVDPTRIEMGWIIDFCAQALRNIGNRFRRPTWTVSPCNPSSALR